MAIAGLNVLQARQSYKAEKSLAEQAFRDREEQIADNRSAVQLEAIQKANMTKQIFFEKQASNRALLSPSGIAQSNSFEAAMKENKSQMIQELNVNALQAMRKQSELAYASIQSSLKKQADIEGARTRFTKSLMDSAMTAAMAGEGLSGGGGQSVGASSANFSSYTAADQSLSTSSSFMKRFNT